MKRENAKVTSWLTITIDLISVITAFYLSAYIRGGIIHAGYFDTLYSNIFILLVLSIILINYIDHGNKDIFKRGFLVELVHIIKDQGKLGLILLAYVFAVKQSGYYSRIFLCLFLLLNTLISYVLRSYCCNIDLPFILLPYPANDLPGIPGGSNEHNFTTTCASFI
jgi:hypothetical protein